MWLELHAGNEPGEVAPPGEDRHTPAPQGYLAGTAALVTNVRGQSPRPLPCVPLSAANEQNFHVPVGKKGSAWCRCSALCWLRSYPTRSSRPPRKRMWLQPRTGHKESERTRRRVKTREGVSWGRGLRPRFQPELVAVGTGQGRHWGTASEPVPAPHLSA